MGFIAATYVTVVVVRPSMNERAPTGHFGMSFDVVDDVRGPVGR